MRPERVVADCRAVLPDDAILTCDVGVSHNWYMQFWEARRPQTMLNSWGFSGMGFGAAGVLGAKLAAPDRPCVSVTGDGCFTMVPHVLCTAVEYNIPVVWVIWNNFGWMSIRDIQMGMFGGRELGTAFYQGANKTPYNPDFAAWARAAGVEAMTITKSEDFRGALEHAIKANKPFLLDVHVDAEVKPPSTGTWQLPPTPYREPAFGERWLPDRRALVAERRALHLAEIDVDAAAFDDGLHRRLKSVSFASDCAFIPPTAAFDDGGELEHRARRHSVPSAGIPTTRIAMPVLRYMACLL